LAELVRNRDRDAAGHDGFTRLSWGKFHARRLGRAV
jgi:hypothetical protein